MKKIITWFFILLAFAIIIIFTVNKRSNNNITETTGLTVKTEKVTKAEEKNYDQKIELVKKTVTFKDGSKADFEIAKEFNIAVAAEGLGKARFMAKSPDGRLFVPDMVNMNLSHEGKIYILENFDPDTKQFKTRNTYLSGLRGPNSIAFYTDEGGKSWIYIALTANLIRYPYKNGDLKPTSPAEVVTAFPNKQVPGESSIVWHITRTIKFKGDRLFVSVGSGCNSCEQPEGEMRAMIYSMNPDGTDKKIYATGIRNAVGFTWADEELYATVNGVDHLGKEAPNELMYKLEEGKNYGWPYCYESNKKVYEDGARKWKKPFSCSDVPLTFVAFEPHAAPLGITYFPKDSHPQIKDSFLVALHGSFEPKIRNGYHIMKVSKEGNQEIFMDGFLANKETSATTGLINTAYAHTDVPDYDIERTARPVDIMQYDKNSFFFTDDHKGRLYYIYASPTQ